MVDQLIKSNIPVHVLLVFLDLYCTRTAVGHTFTKEAYKRAALRGGVRQFTRSLISYYHKSKQYYLTRKQSFATVATLVRQLCRHLEIPYATAVVYRGADYSIVYSLYDGERAGR